jgi:AcrR family transcriptional regulator
MDMPRPAPDLDLRREQVVTAARLLAESGGWPAVTMRALAGELGVTQPVLYSAFTNRQAVVDAVALTGFADLAAAMNDTPATPMARMQAYLTFAGTHPHTYEAMFTMPSGLTFGGVTNTPEPLWRAFNAIAAAFPDNDETRIELAWATWHGLVTLTAGGRLRPHATQERLNLANRMLTE